MSKIQKTCIAALLSVIGASCLAGCKKTTYAQPEQANEIIAEQESYVSPRGLYTSLGLSIYSENGQIYAAVKNKFTLFPATVQVNVELYSSVEYQQHYSQMTLTASNATYDLNFGETITASAPIGGVTKYWLARAYYKIDNNDWEERVTQIMKYDANGTADSQIPVGGIPEDSAPDIETVKFIEYHLVDSKNVDRELNEIVRFPTEHRIADFLPKDNSMAIEVIFKTTRVEPNFPRYHGRQDVLFKHIEELKPFTELFANVKLDLVDNDICRDKPYDMMDVDAAFRLSIHNNGKMFSLYMCNSIPNELNINLILRYMDSEKGIHNFYAATVSDELISTLNKLAEDTYIKKYGYEHVSGETKSRNLLGE